MPELNINELKWIASFYSARNLQKISESDYDQPGRLNRNNQRWKSEGEKEREEEGGREGESEEDTTGRICAKCRSFREHYRLPGNARVCRNAGAHDKVDGAGGWRWGGEG